VKVLPACWEPDEVTSSDDLVRHEVNDATLLEARRSCRRALLDAGGLEPGSTLSISSVLFISPLRLFFE
jgi:hypothetical protein